MSANPRQLSLFSLPSPISVAASPVPGAAQERAPAPEARAEFAAQVLQQGDAPPTPSSLGEGSGTNSARTGPAGDVEHPSPAPDPVHVELASADPMDPLEAELGALPVPNPPADVRPVSRLEAGAALRCQPGTSPAWRPDAEQARAAHPVVELGNAEEQEARLFAQLIRFALAPRRYPGEGRQDGQPAPETFFEAMASLRRVPMLGDPCPPWAFRGWLLWYVQESHAAVYGPCNRWDYFLACLDGRLPEGPIPWLDWTSAGLAPRGTAQVTGLLDHFATAGVATGARALERLVDWMSWGLGITRDYPRVSDALAAALYRSFNAFLWVAHPADYLGHAKAELTSNRFNSTAFFPTPSTVVEAMTRMTFTGGEDYRLRSVCDPCVGTGRFLLHASNYSLRLAGQDIDPICVAITKINGAIYAPWMTWRIPGLERLAVAHGLEVENQAGAAP